MGTWKEILTRTGILLLAAAVVFGLSLPLAQSGWADGLHSAPDGEQVGVEQADGEVGESTTEGEPEGVPTGVMTLLPFVKMLVMMGIPGLITGVVLWLTRRTRRARRRSQLVPA